MKTLDQWLELYAVSHQNPVNKVVHKVCVPVITFTVFGLLWSLPTPAFLEAYTYANFATLFGALALIFYARLSIRLAVVILAQILFMLWLCHFTAERTNLLALSVILFVLAWIGQFWGHKVEGKKPSFLEDVQFLLIGPIWVIKDMTGFPRTK